MPQSFVNDNYAIPVKDFLIPFTIVEIENEFFSLMQYTISTLNPLVTVSISEKTMHS